MRVPQVDRVDHKLGRDLLEEIVAVVVLVYVALDIGGLLQE